MSIAVLHHEALQVSAVISRTPLEPGAILVLRGETDTTLEDFSALVDLWRCNPWCAVASLELGAGKQAALRSLLPDGMRVVDVVEGPHVANATLAAVRSALPSDAKCITYMANRLGGPTALAVAEAIDRDLVGTGARRGLARRGLPPLGYWRTLFATIGCLGRAMAYGYTEAISANVEGISTKTLSRRCGHLFGLSWRQSVGLSVWEATLEVALRHRELARASSAAVPLRTLGEPPIRRPARMDNSGG